MYTRRNIRWSLILHLAWLKFAIFAAWAAVVTVVFIRLQERGIDCSLPIAPMGTIGVAVAFYVGFKNNQAYDRGWEARKIWGGIVNVSRAWGNQVLAFISSVHAEDSVDEATVREVQREMIYRHLAWINVLRFQLRRETPFGYRPRGSAKRYRQSTDVEAMREQITQLMPKSELGIACTKVNSATQVLRLQGDHLRRVRDEMKLTEDFRLISLVDLITEMYSLQGKCERLKNTPFPRQYAYFSSVFVMIFVTLLPFGLVGEMASRGDLLIWLTVPLSMIVSWMFSTMEAVGDSSEDPFENFINDIPMTALCRTIEIDLRQMLGETDVPEPMLPVDDVLM